MCLQSWGIKFGVYREESPIESSFLDGLLTLTDP